MKRRVLTQARRVGLGASLPPPTPRAVSFPRLTSCSSWATQVLALSSGSRKTSAVGDVVNLVSVDVQRATESVMYLNGLWLPLIWIVVCFVYLWQVRRAEGAGFELNPSPPPLLLLLFS